MRSLLGYLSVSILAAFLGFLAVPLSTRLFDQQTLGQLNLLVSMASVAYTVILFGFDQGLIRFFYDQESDFAKRRLLRTSLIIPIFLSLVIIVGSLAINGWFASYFNSSSSLVAIVFGLLVLTLVLIRFCTCYARVRNKLLLFGLFTLVNVLFSKCLYILNVGKKDFDTTLVICCVASVMMSLICATFLFRNCRTPPHMEQGIAIDSKFSTKSLVSYSVPLMPAMLLSSVNSYIPLFFVRASQGFADVGLLSMAITVSSVINMIGSGINSFWPTYVFKNYKYKLHTIQLFHKALTACMLLIASSLIMLRFLIPIFLGAGYEKSANLFSILIISPLCYTIGETAGIGIHIRRKSKLYLIIYSSGLLLNIVLCYCLSNLMGVIGSAISIAVVAIAMLLLKAILGNCLYDSTGSLKWLLSSIALVGLQAIVCQLSIDYLLTVVISLLCIVIFPLLVGKDSFLNLILNVKNLLSQTVNLRS